MSLPATDNFDRANESPLGGNWTAPDGVADSKFFLVGDGSHGHLEGQGGATLQLMYWNADSFGADHKSVITLAGSALGSAGTYAGAAVRVQASGQSGYLFGDINGGGYKIQRIDTGTRTNLADCTGTPTANDVLRLEVTGSSPSITITAYVNDVQVGQVTGETTYATGSAGLFGYSSSSFTLDVWSGDNLSAVVPTPGSTATIFRCLGGG